MIHSSNCNDLQNSTQGCLCSNTKKGLESFQTGYQYREGLRELEEEGDHLFTEESLKLLHEVNESFGIVRSSGNRFKIVKRSVESCCNKRIDTYFTTKADFKAIYGNLHVMRRKGKGEKLVRIPLSKAWLKWSGKRVFSLCG